jgi:hypothetical protein
LQAAPGLQAVPVHDVRSAGLQPQVEPFKHWGPGLHVAVQSTHVLPVLPHALGSAPSPQVPAELQQPPLQAEVPEPHAEEHCCDVLSHAFWAGQSPTPRHPHGPLAPLRHWLPLAEFVQSKHPPPFEPHAVGSPPLTHCPADEQQPPLHG